MDISTSERVPRNTAREINRKILQQTEMNIARYSSAGVSGIHRRLAELDREWDVERTLEANAASLSLLGSMLGASVDRRWFALPAFVAGFLLQHAIQGWCPPMPLLRRLGFRTANEIDYERYALKAMRGDFREVSDSGNRTSQPSPRQALAAAQR